MLLILFLQCTLTAADGGMTKDWMLNDSITSAETMVKMMFESMSDSMKGVYFNNN